MVTFIVLTVLIVLSVVVIKRTKHDFIEFSLFILAFLCTIFLIIHSLSWGFKSFNYEIFATQRDSFELTLKDARERGSEYETATITKEVAQWNTTLATDKYMNNHWFFGQYVDDRIQTLEPIR